MLKALRTSVHGDDLGITNVFIEQSLDGQHSTFHTGLNTKAELDSVTKDFGQLDSLQSKDTRDTAEEFADSNGSNTRR